MKVPAWVFIVNTILFLLEAWFFGFKPLFWAGAFVFAGLGLAEIWQKIKSGKTVSQETWANEPVHPIAAIIVLSQMAACFYWIVQHLMVHQS